jgi:hypothetical protein
MIKIGIIGLGRIGKVHIKSISTKINTAKVIAAADPFLNDEMRSFAKEFGIENLSLNYKDILNNPEIDAVMVCSSTDTHANISAEAIRAGKHVFCEKPVDHSLEKIRLVEDALKENPVKFQVGFNRRYDHNFAAVREAVLLGKVGEVHITKITSRDPNPPSAEYAKVSGGMLLDMTIHDFDMVRFLTGAEPVKIYVEPAVLVDKAIGEAGDIDTAVITMQMSDGSIAVIDNSRKASYGYDQRAEVFGSLAMAATKNDTASTCVISSESGIMGEKPLYFFLERYMDSFALEVKEFVEAIENDKPIKTGIEDGLRAVAIALAGNISIKEKRTVEISEVLKK